MNPRTKRNEAAERFEERRRREDAAPRLKESVPNLATLKLVVDETHDTMGTGAGKYVRHVVVDRAAALFVIPCGDPACQGGGYDVTDDVMRALRAGKETFAVDDHCHGSTADGPCKRALKVDATATYRV